MLIFHFSSKKNLALEKFLYNFDKIAIIEKFMTENE